MLKNTCDQRGIKFAYTSKLFFGQFTSSMTIRVPKSHPLRTNYIYYPNYVKARATYAHKRWELLIKIIGTGEDSHDWDYKINQSSITFYFGVPTDLENALADVTSRQFLVSRVSVPRNNTDMSQMLVTPNKTVRPRLWRGRYRYRIELNRKFDTHEMITNGLCRIFGGDMSERAINSVRLCGAGIHPTPCLKINDNQAYYNDNRMLYIADEEDVFLARITLHDHIRSIEECILSKDISNEASSIKEAY